VSLSTSRLAEQLRLFGDRVDAHCHLRVSELPPGEND